MDTADTTQSNVLSLLGVSGYDFLLKLINLEDILKCSPEYDPFSEYNNTNARTLRFILKEDRVGFPGAGSLSFIREEHSWIVTESITFELLYVWSTPLLVMPEKDWRGYTVLTIDWFVNTLHHSGVGFVLRDKEITSPATKCGLKILGRAKNALKRKT